MSHTEGIPANGTVMAQTENQDKLWRDDWETIPQFFSGQSVFISGATGFMGKVLVEKLLRSCPGLDKVYILVRAKRGKTAEERLQEITGVELFNKLRTEHPGVIEKKLQMVEGDVTLERLGLSETDEQTLINNVSIVFHCAATVRFNEPLPAAIRMNAGGTKKMIDLALQMPKLKVFLHVSTTYCNCDRRRVEEKIYPPHADWRVCLKLADEMDPAILTILSEKVTGKLPNTYTFTKSLAEHIVYDHRDRLPVVIYRPSIVISSWKDPLVGWIDNINGPVGIMLGYGEGIVRTSLADLDIVPDFMAVDVSIKSIIIAAWKRCQPGVNLKNIEVINGSSKTKSITTREIKDLTMGVATQYPLSEAVWHYATHYTKYKSVFVLHVYLKHLIPAILIDTFLKLKGREPMVLALQRKIFTAMMALSHFILNEWEFPNQNFLNLTKSIRPEDIEDFDYTYDDVEIEDYFRGCIIGGRQYLIKDPLENLPAARIRARRLYWLDWFVKTFFWVMVSVLVYKFYFSEETRVFIRSFLPY